MKTIKVDDVAYSIFVEQTKKSKHHKVDDYVSSLALELHTQNKKR